MEPFKSLGSIDSLLLSEFILQKMGSMSHLKLQKLLYYSEAMHLAYFDTSLIDDEFQAWLHGPVSRKLYNELEDKSVLFTEVQYVKTNNGENEPIDVIKQKLTEEQYDLLCDTLNEYSKLSSIQLENLTHSEMPWIEARIGVPDGERCENIISKETMKSYYKKDLFPV